MCLYEWRLWIFVILIAKPNTFYRNHVYVKSSQYHLLTPAHNSFVTLVNLPNLSRQQLSHLKNTCNVIQLHLSCSCATATVTNIYNASKDSFLKAVSQNLSKDIFCVSLSCVLLFHLEVGTIFSKKYVISLIKWIIL